MKNVTINITAEDLNGPMFNINGCAGYVAVKRKIPNLTSWGFNLGFTKESCDPIYIPDWAGDILKKHATWQRYSGKIGTKAEPFSCVIQVPDHIVTVEDINVHESQDIQISSQLGKQGRVSRIALAFRRFRSSLLGRFRRL